MQIKHTLISFINKNVYIVTLIFSLLFVGSLLIKDINNPYYSYIGDDTPFYSEAKHIADNNFKNISLFSQSGVYGYHPVLDSTYQALFMKIFGYLVGWKLSVIIAFLASAIILFMIGKEIGGQKTGIIATIFYLFSHYLIGFSHIGYNNMNSLFPFLTTILFFFRGHKYGKKIDYLFAGLFSGLSFYTFYSARLVLLVLLPFLFHLLFKNKIYFLYFIFGFIFLFLPFYTVNGNEIFHQSLLKAFEDPAYQSPAFMGIAMYFLGLVIPNYIWAHHFTIGPLIGPILFFYFIEGIITLTKKLRTIEYEFVFLLFWFLFCSIFITVMFHNDEVPTTRLMVVIPSIALVAGHALSKMKNIFLLGSILCIYVFSELYLFYVITPIKYSGRIESKLLIFLKEHKNNVVCIDANDPEFKNTDVFYLESMYQISNLRLASSSNTQCDTKVFSPSYQHFRDKGIILGTKNN